MPRSETVLGVLFGAALGGAATWWSLSRAEGPTLPNGTAAEMPSPAATANGERWDGDYRQRR